MPTLRSHTHLQATQSQAQTKACKRVCLPNRTTDRPTDDREEQRRHNTGLAKVAVRCSEDTFVVNQTFVLRINICGENRHLRQARKRYSQPYLLFSQ
jgi:hypothetical protein